MANNPVFSLIVAIIAALTVFIVCFIAGYSFWTSLGMYTLTGMAVLVIQTFLAGLFGDDKRP